MMQLQYKAMVVHLVLLCLMIASSTALVRFHIKFIKILFKEEMLCKRKEILL